MNYKDKQREFETKAKETGLSWLPGEWGPARNPARKADKADRELRHAKRKEMARKRKQG